MAKVWNDKWCRQVASKSLIRKERQKAAKREYAMTRHQNLKRANV
jgi:hypothetical protein